MDAEAVAGGSCGSATERGESLVITLISSWIFLHKIAADCKEELAGGSAGTHRAARFALLLLPYRVTAEQEAQATNTPTLLRNEYFRSALFLPLHPLLLVCGCEFFRFLIP
ncbi:hypothetical protein SLEP1_g50441 [Rubroshorea leprosula]|uniref:Uncharacterized protein n=1 Tax=Rubroshorea leprosula TaxID=152421 RepID=A0AAV5M3F1_9ROSI|nr:hypothetical protein SLEP1_g50441 [Rubroshorea leprosula]